MTNSTDPLSPAIDAFLAEMRPMIDKLLESGIIEQMIDKLITELDDEIHNNIDYPDSGNDDDDEQIAFAATDAIRYEIISHYFPANDE